VNNRLAFDLTQIFVFWIEIGFIDVENRIKPKKKGDMESELNNLPNVNILMIKFIIDIIMIGAI
jgi:hypothetical protein